VHNNKKGTSKQKKDHTIEQPKQKDDYGHFLFESHTDIESLHNKRQPVTPKTRAHQKRSQECHINKHITIDGQNPLHLAELPLQP
jgi:hypothetical protein